ncbi:Carboxylic ester hydrolase {ECO:0000256/RuleBase:RU361235} {ECO:0000256/RuleBase:RU361235} [Serendipita indica DSM 11827]|uniref:Carboxylic ester hydrolase n=1 Tax=Serendipita indica (strain DSM 11827) TaxID=1109443 RepID=G4TXW9_SERID|nr:Carboxylic ester hydrolase {ECO:0000256/RuleBase:RU361235} {ECO:0000256/RuleBase:RU361235} [Serendipita indica DSM 11827]CCA76162.1 related to esterase [Serendipita indica DSM 11827]
MTSWAVAHPEVVFVSFNYRLNIYGYANSPAISKADTNAGLRDQRTAVEWVVANIIAFGGDPTQITLGGQSAGSGSIGTYIYAYASRPLIRGAILMSGQAATTLTPPPIPIPGVPAAGSNPFPDVAIALGCPLQGDKYKAQLDCVRTKSAEQLMDALNFTNTLGVSPFVDNTTVFTKAEYKSRGRAGNFARIPLLTGTTDKEGDIFVLDRTTNTLNETLSDLLTLSVFRCYDSQQSKYSSSLTSVYRYRYMAIFPALSPPPLRAWHTSDQIVLFDVFPGLAPAATQYLQKAWTAFIVNPSNGLLSLGWKKYQGPGSNTLVDVLKNSTDLQHPIDLEDPTSFDSGCAALGLGL